MVKQTLSSPSSTKNTANTVQNVELKRKFLIDLVNELLVAGELRAVYVGKGSQPFSDHTIILIPGNILTVGKESE